ncbi:MAG: ABC transporter permease [Terriglobia bacterium]
MLSRVVGRSITRRRRRKLLSTLAVTLGIAVSTAVATIALDVGDKVGRELRSFGANISITPAADSLPASLGGVESRAASSSALLQEADLTKLKKIFWRNNIMAFAPLLPLAASVEGHRVELVGSWFDKEIQVDKSETFRTGLKPLHPAWKVTGEWPDDNDPASCLVGRRVAERLGIAPGRTFTANVDSSAARRPTLPLTIRGILDSGSEVDDQIFIPLATAQQLSGLEGYVRRIEVSALTKPEDEFARSDVTRLSAEEFDRWYCTPYVSSIGYQIQQSLPGAEARPVYRVAEAEGSVLNRVGILMALLAGAALVASVLAVASLMLATVIERRAEIGLFKSLGATNASVATIFLLEALIIGSLGGLAGYFAGSLMAWRLSSVVFGLPTGIHWVILPAAVALALAVTLAGSALPLARGLRLSPIDVLRNE